MHLNDVAAVQTIFGLSPVRSLKPGLLSVRASPLDRFEPFGNPKTAMASANSHIYLVIFRFV